MAIYDFSRDTCKPQSGVEREGMKKESCFDKLGDAVYDTLFEKTKNSFGKSELDFFLTKLRETNPKIKKCLIKITEEKSRYNLLLVPLDKDCEPFRQSSSRFLGRRVYTKELTPEFMKLMGGFDSIIYDIK